ncbi:MAG TPA: BlaI/MecI/CopY family transcriptional regulator [Sphingomicrobium sp.]|nr:BlaI/MecI/CopY family transcriptional regulator [Sphingomicrobium sp.]
MTVRTPLPAAEIEKLPPRQRDLVRVICARGGATVRELHSTIPDPPSSPTGLRTLLTRMTRRGLVNVRPSGRHREFFYFVANAQPDAQLNAFDRLARQHFDGSKTQAMEALAKLAANETTKQTRGG